MHIRRKNSEKITEAIDKHSGEVFGILQERSKNLINTPLFYEDNLWKIQTKDPPS